MQNRKSYYVALFGIMLATIFAAMTLDRALSIVIPIGIAWFCLTVTLSFAFMKDTWWIAVFAGLFFGLASLVTAPLGGKYVFLDPRISVLTRVISMTFAYFVYKFVSFLGRNAKNRRTMQYVALSVGAFFGVCANTATVLPALVLWGGRDSVVNLFMGIAVINFIPELVIATLAVPPIVLGVRKAMHFGIDGKSDKFAEA